MGRMGLTAKETQNHVIHLGKYLFSELSDVPNLLYKLRAEVIVILQKHGHDENTRMFDQNETGPRCRT